MNKKGIISENLPFHCKIFIHSKNTSYCEAILSPQGWLRRTFYWSKRVFHRSCYSLSGQNNKIKKKTKQISPPTQGSSLHVPECALCRSIQGLKARRSSCSCRISLLKVSSFLSSRSCLDELSFPLSTHILHHIEN